MVIVVSHFHFHYCKFDLILRLTRQKNTRVRAQQSEQGLLHQQNILAHATNRFYKNPYQLLPGISIFETNSKTS
jgi:hypothetical protein